MMVDDSGAEKPVSVSDAVIAADEAKLDADKKAVAAAKRHAQSQAKAAAKAADDNEPVANDAAAGVDPRLSAGSAEGTIANHLLEKHGEKLDIPENDVETRRGFPRFGVVVDY